MNKDSISKTSTDEYPQVTQADFDRAVLRRNLEPDEEKQRITLALDVEVIRYFKTKGGKQGYHNLINETLKRIVRMDIAEQNGFEEILRKIIREELAAAGNAH
ncbi:MAG: toxin-antitoxin system antitoxin subunit [Candidatus Electrothrix sp. ATG1]|nr:toxin-antitoxin system antitoxin subunit [Candidatus Electrothrix sp. ATG1]MCI5209103.1 toxin-antitoxin system antitoxin subunit [Candidatus Electrothrix sp. ATG2]